SFKTNKDVKVVVDSRHTNITIETWGRNEVAIEAFLDSKLSGPEAKALLDSWKLETTGSAGEVRITSGGGVVKNPEMDWASFGESMGHIQELIAPIMTEMVAPMMENLSKNPPLPPDFADKMGSLNFDYEAYQKDGDKYMAKWEKKIEKTFGKDFEASMEKWAEQFEKNAEVWGKNLEMEMEVKGEKFEKSMEAWAENFGAQMEQWGENLAKEMEGMENNAKMIQSENGNIIVKGAGTKADRNIKVKIPAGAKLELDVRHGAVKLGKRTNNLKANLSHSSLTGDVIDGNDTDVKVSYSPVTVSQWNYGI